MVAIFAVIIMEIKNYNKIIELTFKELGVVNSFLVPSNYKKLKMSI